MVIAVGFLGAFVGIMTKLLIESPEVFLNVLAILSTIVPFLLAIGTIIWLGIRRRPYRSAPICSQCEYDLRHVTPNREPSCPECGADLTQPRAVLFAGERGSQWGLVTWGGALLLMPIIFTLARVLILPTGNALRLLGNQRLVQNRLPNQVNTPSVWNELEHRLNTGALSQQEVDDAVKELIAYMKSTRPNGWDQPLPWQRKFVQAAVQRKMISDDVFADLCDAFFGPQPVINPLPRVSTGQNGFHIGIKYGNPFSDNSGGIGAELLWDVKRVLLDKAPIKIRPIQKHGEHWSGFYEGKMDAGDHLITVDLECAYVDPSNLTGLNRNKLSVDKWPQVRKRWTKTVTARLKVDSVDKP
jgi:hypothetical protein